MDCESMLEFPGGVWECNVEYVILISEKTVDWVRYKCYNNAIFMR